MAPKMRLERWYPAEGTPELPLSRLDMSWTGYDESITCIGLYPDDYQVIKTPAKGMKIIFRDVLGFMSFEEYADILVGTGLEYPRIHNGDLGPTAWPFVEVQNSTWLAEACARHSVLKPEEYRHWAILTSNETFHVFTPSEQPPEFVDWVR